MKQMCDYLGMDFHTHFDVSLKEEDYEGVY